MRASLVLYESGPRLGESLAALADGLGSPRGGGGPRNQQAVRGTRHRHAGRACRALCRCAAQGRDRHRRRPAGRAGSGQRRGAGRRPATRRWRSMSPSRAAAEVAASLGVPRKRAYARALELGGERLNRQRRRSARPPGGDARRLVAAAAGLADPRPARPRSRRRSRPRRAARPHAGLRRGQAARHRGRGGLGARRISPAPCRGRRRAACAALRPRRRRHPHRRDVHRPRPPAAPSRQCLARVTSALPSLRRRS